MSIQAQHFYPIKSLLRRRNENKEPQVKTTFRGKDIKINYINKIRYLNLSYPEQCTPSSCDPYKVDLDIGSYQIELWGASGGAKDTEKTGRGAYVFVVFTLAVKTTFWAFVGSEGTTGTSDPSFGGGGPCRRPSGYTGGGATDIRTIKNDVTSRIFVAGAGGGEAFYHEGIKGGDAGTLVGFDGSVSNTLAEHITCAKGGNQYRTNNRWTGYTEENRLSSDGELGRGGMGGQGIDHAAGGGGSGYYGGGGGAVANEVVGSGAGGSSYIGNCSKMIIHSKYMLGGNQDMPGLLKDQQKGNIGNGFIRIVILKDNTEKKYRFFSKNL